MNDATKSKSQLQSLWRDREGEYSDYGVNFNTVDSLIGNIYGELNYSEV